ncbi:hypothetical protein EAJ15_01185 [Parabacteroides merdae]|nr:hypothetical protein EAJ15_01185 [Parabacteroides merdae]
MLFFYRAKVGCFYYSGIVCYMANYNNPFFCLFLFYLKIQFVFILLFALIPIFGIEVEAYHLDFSSALQPSLLP